MCFAVQTKGIHVELDKNVENVILQRNMVSCPDFGPKQASICTNLHKLTFLEKGITVKTRKSQKMRNPGKLWLEKAWAQLTVPRNH